MIKAPCCLNVKWAEMIIVMDWLSTWEYRKRPMG